MSATCTVEVQCPQCQTVIPITVAVGLTRDDGDRQLLTFDPDMSDLWAHAWGHEAPAPGPSGTEGGG